jgi:hypothetical protein
MFPVPPWPIIILILLIELGIVAAGMIGYALLLNWILRTPLRSHLVSTGILAIVVYFVTSTIFLYMLPPLRWVNEVPQDTRTWLWDHSRMLSLAVTFVCVSLWQLIVRTRRPFITRSA